MHSAERVHLLSFSPFERRLYSFSYIFALYLLAICNVNMTLCSKPIGFIMFPRGLSLHRERSWARSSGTEIHHIGWTFSFIIFNRSNLLDFYYSELTAILSCCSWPPLLNWVGEFRLQINSPINWQSIVCITRTEYSLYETINYNDKQTKRASNPSGLLANILSDAPHHNPSILANPIVI